MCVSIVRNNNMLFSITSISKTARVNISQLTNRLWNIGDNMDNWEILLCK